MEDALDVVRAAARASPGGVYLGGGVRGPVWAGSERAVLVLGPPRSGKTSSIVVPTVLASPGSVVSTSTKPDVLRATAHARRRSGHCLLYDPSGTVEPPPGVELVRWSPVPACRRWDDALVVAHEIVATAQRAEGHHEVEATHWSERAGALLAPLLHAAALGDSDMGTVLRWVQRRQAGPAIAVLDRAGAATAADQLADIAGTEPRELSGIWSTASGSLGGYRSEAALATTLEPNFDAGRFCAEPSTLYICATGRRQAAVAPLVVGMLGEIRDATYARHRASGISQHPSAPPVVLALDELANIAPIPDLPAMVSEGGGQGLTTLACFQDLSQARARWGARAEGFPSLFSIKVVLAGIGDLRTLQTLSGLVGEHDTTVCSTSRPIPESPGAVLVRHLLGAPGARPRPQPSITYATRRQPRLAPDAISRGRAGHALVLDHRHEHAYLRLTPWFAERPWCDLGRDPYRLPGDGIAAERETPGHER